MFLRVRMISGSQTWLWQVQSRASESEVGAWAGVGGQAVSTQGFPGSQACHLRTMLPLALTGQ